MLKLINEQNIKNLGTLNDITNNIDEIVSITDSKLLQSLNKNELYSLRDIATIFKCTTNHIRYILLKGISEGFFEEDESIILNTKEEIEKLLEDVPKFKSQITKCVHNFRLVKYSGVIKLILLSSDKYISLYKEKCEIIKSYNTILDKISPKTIDENRSFNVIEEISFPIDNKIENKIQEEQEDCIEKSYEEEPEIKVKEENIKTIDKDVIHDNIIKKYSDSRYSKDLFDFDKISFEFIDLYAEELQKIEKDKLKAYLLATDAVLYNQNILEVLKNLIEEKIKIDFDLRKSIFTKKMFKLTESKCNGNYQGAYILFSNKFKKCNNIDLASLKKTKNNNIRFVDIINRYDLWESANKVLDELIKE